MLQAETFDYKNINWEAAFEASMVLNDSFRQDFLRVHYWPKEYQLDGLPASASHAELLADPTFKKVTDHFARHISLSVRQNPRFRLMLIKKEGERGAPGKVVSMATFILPYYQSVEEPSFFQRLKTQFIALIYRLRNIWAFKSFSNPLLPPNMQSEFDLGSVQCNTLPTEERTSYLKSLTRAGLQQEHYPKGWSYYLNFLAVASSEQAKGTGRQTLDQLIDQLKTKFGIKEPPFDGPAKLQLFSSPAGVNFYKRYGFSVGASYQSRLFDGSALEHVFFYKNLT